MSRAEKGAIVSGVEADADARLAAVGGAALVAFTHDVIALLGYHLGHTASVYLVGSIAAGDARPEVSDLDLLVVVDEVRSAQVRLAAGEQVADRALDCPLRGVEVVVYAAEVARRPVHPVGYALNINGGRQLERKVDVGGEPAFWFLLDLSAARDIALTLRGPPVHDVVGAPEDADVLSALEASLRWHADAGQATADAVLNACRSWHWVDRRQWVSKTAAGVWAVEAGGPPIVAEALAARGEGVDAVLDARATTAFSTEVLARVTAQAAGGGKRVSSA